MIYEKIEQLTAYGLNCGLFEKEDTTFVRNRLYELFGLAGAQPEKTNDKSQEDKVQEDLETILKGLLDYGYEQGLFPENSVTYRDLFDTRIMGELMPRPGEVIRKFWSLYEKSPELATDYFYELSQNSDYIRRYRIKRDVKWVVDTVYGQIDITINLAKPEKDPKAIAASRLQVQGGYPKCQLCWENEGYAGRVDHPARQNHRIIPVVIDGNEWGFQYSPYVYYNEHCIVFHSQHVPMQINQATFRKLFDFVKQFPHYFVGSNADLPIVGGSILTHDHFQGGRYEFAMAKAPVEQEFTVRNFEDVSVGIVKWPMSVLRLKSKNTDRLVELGNHILEKWRGYSDESVSVYAFTGEEPHNTITPIARKRDGFYELDLVLRNNLTTEEYPLGMFHPHEELHHIKKENIGLIEVMGLAVLPSRLKREMELLNDHIMEQKDITQNEDLKKHADWVSEFLPKYQITNREQLEGIIRQEIGMVFSKVLEHAGVFKQDTPGQNAFVTFVKALDE